MQTDVRFTAQLTYQPERLIPNRLLYIRIK